MKNPIHMKINLQISKRIDQSDESRKIYDLCDLKKKKKEERDYKKEITDCESHFELEV